MIRYLISLGIMLIWVTPALASSCFTPIFPGINRTMVENVKVVVSPTAAAMVTGGATSINNGFKKWNNSPCQSSQESAGIRPFPVFSSTAGSGTINIVREDALSSSFIGPDGQPARDSCASINMSMSSANDNAIIRLYSTIKGDNDDVFQCNWDSAERTALMVAHELGHYLGLRESACSGSIMGGWDIQWNSATEIATYLGAGHAIRDYECEKADEVSISPSESSYEEQACSTDPNCDPYAPCWSDPYCTCPILLDLDNDRFQLAAGNNPVRFDIDNDGEAEWITWTQAGTQDAFLCWDRNGNGKIDNGSELFGNSTQLADGTISPFGYIALSELDGISYGGNLDGIIDARDEIYSTLCVWTDSDHDGQTGPTELQSLNSAGVTAVGVDWTTRAERDKAGNLFLYHGQAVMNVDGNPVFIPTTDVYFVEVEAPWKRVVEK